MTFFANILFLCTLFNLLHIISSRQKNFKANFGIEYSNDVSFTSEITYEFNYKELINQTQAVRIYVSGNSDANEQIPIMVVIRQQRGILSFQIPLAIHDKLYYNVSRTLCPVKQDLKLEENEDQTIYIDISTFYTRRCKFSLQATLLRNFEMNIDTTRVVSITPAEPVFFKFRFPFGIDNVLVHVTSKTSECMVASVQGIRCPVYDSDKSVEYTGFYETVQTHGTITVNRDDFDDGSFYVVLVLKPSDEECVGKGVFYENDASKGLKVVSRMKVVEIHVQEGLTRQQYLLPIISVLSFYMCFYVAAGLISLLYYIGRRKRSNLSTLENYDELEGRFITSNLGHSGPYGSVLSSEESKKVVVQREIKIEKSEAIPHVVKRSADLDDDINLISTTDFNKLDDPFEDELFQRIVFVSDLSRHENNNGERKNNLYHWYIVIISIFYGLPVVQLVLTYQKVFHTSGNEDICFYNFDCANPFGVFTAFNAVYSNIGYITLGILFLGLIYRRQRLHGKIIEKYEENERRRGLPQHFGLFYAMGIALIMEGILSACYHVCPSFSTFQFDTAFMYILVVLLMLKIYQTRHPDVNASPTHAYLLMALLIILSVFGVMVGTPYFWAFFSISYILFSLFLSAKLYYSRWDCGLEFVKRFFSNIRKIGLKDAATPIYTDRFVFVFFLNLFNIMLSVYALAFKPLGVGGLMLNILMMNLILYFGYYVMMKILAKERFLLMPTIYIAIDIIAWTAAIYFFFQRSTEWQKTAAQSREMNAKCILLNFYDVHDVWHFLSAVALFFSFMSLLTLDDDLVDTPREQIRVF